MMYGLIGKITAVAGQRDALASVSAQPAGSAADPSFAASAI